MATRIAGLVPAWITITGIWKAFDVILGPYVDTKNCAMPCWMLLIRARLKKSCKPCKRLIPHAVHWKQGHKTSDALPFISRGPKPMQRERARVNAMVARAQVLYLYILLSWISGIWKAFHFILGPCVNTKARLKKSCTASRSFHMPLFTKNSAMPWCWMLLARLKKSLLRVAHSTRHSEISPKYVPARNLSAHLKKGAMSEVLNLMSKGWQNRWNFRFDVAAIVWKRTIVPQTLL